MDEFIEKVRELDNGDLEKYQKVKQPVYINKNIYYNAPHFDREKDYLSFEKVPHFNIMDEDDAVYLEIDLDEESFKRLRNRMKMEVR